MTRFLSLLPAFVLAGFAATAAPRPGLPPDSIGVEYRNNKILIKHRVVAGETLYGLSRRYAVPVEQIVETNPALKGALVTGQVVLVPPHAGSPDDAPADYCHPASASIGGYSRRGPLPADRRRRQPRVYRTKGADAVRRGPSF